MTLLQKLTPVILGAFLVVSLGFFITADASALNIFEGVNAARGEGQPDDLFGNGGVITTITNVLLFIIGALSVIMLIIGGLRYVVSGGNATAVTAAKNTILYAIVGLIIAFLAYAAINFVISSITPGGGGGTNV
ncbi:hypothetical protein H7200_00725 [Candidatus Saccharibacteria bacterium]|nr:hypothetical protein [Candidatus Saccharibacteria bacterium]